jgi:large subunit ribosomal protein L18
MKSTRMKQIKKVRRVRRVRSRVKGTAERPRLAVARSLKHISAQVINDVSRKTLASASDSELKDAKGAKPLEIASKVGKLVAEKAKSAGVKTIVFDRRDKRYHGRVKALAEGAREGGLEF